MRAVDLIFRADEQDLAWIEVKVGTPESGNQLANYAGFLREDPHRADTRLVYLTRLGAARPTASDRAAHLVRVRRLAGRPASAQPDRPRPA